MAAYGNLSGDLASPNFLNQVAGYLGGEAAPGIAQQGLTEATALAQGDVTGAQVGLGAANLANQTGYSFADALLNEQGIGLQSQGLAQQAGTAAEQQAIEQQQYGGQQAQLGLQEKGTALQQANLAYQLPINTEAQVGGAAASGALNTQGDKQKQASVQQQYQYNQGELGLTAQNQYIQGQLNQLGQRSEQAGYQGQEANLANQQQQLSLAAQQQGISAQQAQSQLAYGLGQLGIQADPTSVMAQAAGAQSGQASGYGAILAQAGATTGLGPGFLAP